VNRRTRTIRPRQPARQCPRKLRRKVRRNPHHPSGMTLVEMALNIVVTMAVMGVLVLVSSMLRSDTAEQETRQTLLRLRVALETYHDRHGAWPAGDTDATLAALLDDPVCRGLLTGLPQPRGDGSHVVYDGFGRPVHYQPPSPDGATTADFVSRGPDGELGDASHPRAAMDNLYGIEVKEIAEQDDEITP